jgi:hypothetical protein
MAHISPFHTLDQRLSPLPICTATVYEIFRLDRHTLSRNSRPHALRMLYTTPAAAHGWYHF